MGQRARTLTQILGFDGFRVTVHFETKLGMRIAPQASPAVLRAMTLVLEVTRRWLSRCSGCRTACRVVHEHLRPRRWVDLPWAEHPVVIEYAPVRVKCRKCKATRIVLFAMDMHEPFAEAVRQAPGLAHVAIVHDPFHVMRRAGEAVDEVRRQVLFRAGPELRAVGRGKRWLFLRSHARLNDQQRREVAILLRANHTLMHAYTVKEHLRDVLRSDSQQGMDDGPRAVLRRTARRANVPMRKLHESLLAHFAVIVALGKHHPPTERIEALNNNWETLVRRGRRYRDLHWMLRRLRFMTINPLRTSDGFKRFVALGATPTFAPRIAA